MERSPDHQLEGRLLDGHLYLEEQLISFLESVYGRAFLLRREEVVEQGALVRVESWIPEGLDLSGVLDPFFEGFEYRSDRLSGPILSSELSGGQIRRELRPFWGYWIVEEYGDHRLYVELKVSPILRSREALFRSFLETERGIGPSSLVLKVKPLRGIEARDHEENPASLTSLISALQELGEDPELYLPSDPDFRVLVIPTEVRFLDPGSGNSLRIDLAFESLSYAEPVYRR